MTITPLKRLRDPRANPSGAVALRAGDSPRRDRTHCGPAHADPRGALPPLARVPRRGLEITFGCHGNPLLGTLVARQPYPLDNGPTFSLAGGPSFGVYKGKKINFYRSSLGFTLTLLTCLLLLLLLLPMEPFHLMPSTFFSPTPNALQQPSMLKALFEPSLRTLNGLSSPERATLTDIPTFTCLSVSPSAVTLRHQLAWTWYSPGVLLAMETIKLHETQQPLWTTSVKMAIFDSSTRRWKPLEPVLLLRAGSETLPN